MVPPAPKRSSSGCGVNTRIVLSCISSRRGSSAPATAAAAIRISRAEQRHLILVSLGRLSPRGRRFLTPSVESLAKIARRGTANLGAAVRNCSSALSEANGIKSSCPAKGYVVIISSVNRRAFLHSLARSAALSPALGTRQLKLSPSAVGRYLPHYANLAAQAGLTSPTIIR